MPQEEMPILDMMYAIIRHRACREGCGHAWLAQVVGCKLIISCFLLSGLGGARNHAPR